MNEKELAGLESGTAPELNNASVPTPEQEENAGIEPTVDPVEESVEENESNFDPELGIGEASATKTFTQSQVDEIAGKARKEGRDKALKDTFSRYGVTSVEELDDLFGDAQRYDLSREEFTEKEKAWKTADEERNAELTSVKEKIALLESGIDKNRYEDAKLILRGKGLDVTAENIMAELATHPEWKPAVPSEQPKQISPELPPVRKVETKITVPPTLGNNSSDNPEPELTERERALRMFKV